MRMALQQAEISAKKEEVPVGAVLLNHDGQFWLGHNEPIGNHDPTSHAEISAIRKAAQAMSNYRLSGSTLYVTLEPCTMCLGAIVHARVNRLVFATREPRFGAVVTSPSTSESSRFNHHFTWDEGLYQAESALLLKTFFRSRRSNINK